MDGRRPALQRVGHVGERRLRMRLEVIGQARGRGSSAVAVRADSTSSCAARRVGRRSGRRLLEHDMGVGAADAERADPGAPRRGPSASQGARSRWRRTGSRQIERGVGRCEVDQRRQLALLQRQHGLDEAGDAGGGVEVADVGLQRTERQKPPRRRPRGRPASARRSRSGRRAACRCRGPRRRRCCAATRRPAPAPGDHLDLTLDARRGEARLAGAVVVDRDAADHRVDGVAIGERVGQALEHDDAGAGAGTVPRASASNGRQCPSGERIMPSW